MRQQAVNRFDKVCGLFAMIYIRSKGLSSRQKSCWGAEIVNGLQDEDAEC